MATKRSDTFSQIYKKVSTLRSNCESMTVNILKIELGKLDLSIFGKKSFLVERLFEAKVRDLFKNKTNKDLRIELKKKGLPVAGAKDKKIERLLSVVLKSEDSDLDYSLMTVKELKSELKKRGLPISGIKSKLIKRLEAEDLGMDYGKMTVKELRAELKKLGLKVSGNKKTIIRRLKESKTTPNYKYMTNKELRQLCHDRGLKRTGNKAALVNRLTTGDVNQVHNPYSGLPSTTATSFAMGGDNAMVGKIVAGSLGFFLFLGCLGIMSGEKFDCDNGERINAEYVNDGDNDCGDNSDEYSYSSSYSSGSSGDTWYDEDAANSYYGTGSSNSGSSNSGSSSSGCTEDAYMYYDESSDILYLYDPCTGSMYAY